MNAIESTEHYKDRIKAELNNTLTETSLSGGTKRTGKVRDQYNFGDKVVLITTDRQSAFDRVLASIPFKGQVLNLTSAWWFEQTKHIKYCGNNLPEDLVKNQKLTANMLTPTTKEEHHDRPIAPDEIVSEGWMMQEDWNYCSERALELFAFGQKKAAENGMILVDTKYEMGRDSSGEIMLIDEIHTPDSSRYWIAKTYGERMAAGQEPQNIDKEFLRLWFVDNCDPYNDETLPEAPEELVAELSSRYIYLYETITGRLFPFPDSGKPVNERINENLKEVL